MKYCLVVQVIDFHSLWLHCYTAIVEVSCLTCMYESMYMTFLYDYLFYYTGTELNVLLG